jgi:hypothetical protein
MLYTVLQIGALLLTLESAIFLALGGLGLSVQSIAQLSGTYWGYNKHLVESLARQNADTWMGVMLLTGAFALQVVSAWCGPTMDDIGPANRLGVAATVLVGFLLFFICLWGSRRYASHLASRTCELMQRQNPAANHRHR